MESTEPPYPTVEIVRPPPQVTGEAPDHRNILQEMTFHRIHSRLLEIDCKMSRLESKFYESFSRLESSVAKCHQTIELVNESLGRLGRNGTLYGSAEPPPPREMVLNLKFGRKEHKQLIHTIHQATNPGGTSSLSEQVMSNPSSSYNGCVIARKQSGLLTRIKNQVRSAFSVPCIVTPTFVVYPPPATPTPLTSGSTMGTMVTQGPINNQASHFGS
nr:uncharacterized protein LOC109409766 isoform X1 [Aedes albopictus]